MQQSLHDPRVVQRSPQRCRTRRSSACIVLVLFTLVAAGLVLATKRAQGRASAHSQGPEDMTGLVRDYQEASPVRTPPDRLPEILAHPELIPSHHHPLLGMQAPDFELADQDGKPWSLRQLLASGPVVLVFYHGSCPLCLRQLFERDRDMPLFRALGGQVVAISSDASELTRQRFRLRGALGFPLLSDPGNRVARTYQVFRHMPDGTMAGAPLHGTFIVDRSGTVSWVNIGDAPFRRDSVLLCQLAKMEGRLSSVRSSQ